MKRQIKAIAGMLLGALLVLAGCTDMLNSPESAAPGSNGNVAIQISHGEAGTARTLMPEFTGLTYELTFAGPTGERHGTETVSVNTPTEITLAQGQWTITATAKEGSRPTAQGSWTGTVGSGTTPVSIQLRPISGGIGVLSYKVTFPSGVTSSTLTLTANGSTVGTPVSNLTSGAEATIPNLPAGAYLLNISLVNGGVTISRIESAHIYAGLTTSAVYEITGAEFLKPAAPVAPTVSAGNTQLAVSWTAVTGATAYEVWCGTSSSSDSASKFGSDITSGTTATITSLTNGTIYYVWVKAKNAGGTSDFSPAAVAVPWNTTAFTALQLTGVWDSFSDGYVISATGLAYDDGGVPATYEWPSTSFAGNIKYVSLYGTDKGVIIIEYTEEPDSPYGPDGSTYEGIYFKKETTDSFKMANAYVASGDAITTLAAAIATFTESNESTLASTLETTAYTQFRQSGAPVDMGALRGTWQGDEQDVTDNGGTYLRITDYQFILYMGGVDPSMVGYSGVIVERTDPSANSGRIYIQVKEDMALNVGDMSVDVDDYYAIAWTKSGNVYRFSVYLDNQNVVNSDLDTLRTVGDDEFVEDPGNGLLATDSHYNFTKQ
jgi:hypothetical protein